MSVPGPSPHRDRTLLLLDRRRYDLALPHAQAWLAADPESPVAHAVLAVVLARLGRGAEGAVAGDRAVALAPDLAFAHYARAVAFEQVNRHTLAAAAAEEAIRLAPGDPDYHACLAAIRAAQGRWADALAAAERALARDACHVGGLNLRAVALRELGRADEAADATTRALARAPESDLAHANAGWARLEAGDAEGALPYFETALRLDPEDAWAQAGFARAARGRRGAGALLLRAARWASRRSTAERWAIGAAFLLTAAAGRGVVAAVPEAGPVVVVVLVLLGALTAAAWFAERLFDAVSARLLDRAAGNADATPWVGVALLTAGAFGLPGLARGDAVAAAAGFAALALVLPLRAVAAGPSGRGRRWLGVYAGLLSGGGVLLVLAVASSAPGGRGLPASVWLGGALLAAASLAAPLLARRVTARLPS